MFRGTFHRVTFLLWIIIVGNCVLSVQSQCSSSQVQCPGRGRCIRQNQLCDGSNNCDNGEDEDADWCENFHRDKNNCRSFGHLTCDYNCKSWHSACISFSTCINNDRGDQICTVLRNRKLPEPVITAVVATPSPPKSIDMEEVARYLSAINCSVETTPCPYLYSPVTNGTCVAFLPFKMTWPEAKVACQSIAGNLAEFHSVASFEEIVQYMIQNGFTGDFWTGGYFEVKTETWKWITGETMPSSTPYWTMKYSPECTTRMSSSLGNYNGCFHYVQAPVENKPGYCVAQQFRDMYYLSEDECFQEKRPLCVYG